MSLIKTRKYLAVVTLATLLTSCELTSIIPGLGEDEEDTGSAILTIYNSKDRFASSYDFGNISMESSSTLLLTVRNDGSATAQNMYGVGLGSPFTYTGAGYPGTRGNCGTSLAVTEECTIDITFAPTSYGFYKTEVEMVHADGTTRYLLTALGAWTDGGAAPDEPRISLVFPVVNATYIGSHDTTARTVTVSHDADKIECSHDGGLTYGSCDSSRSVVWTVADFTNDREIYVKATTRGKSAKVHFKPRDVFVGSIITCTVNVTASETMATLAARLVDNSVVCVDSDLSIAGTNLVSISSKNNVKLIGTALNSPAIITTGTGGLAFGTTENVLIASMRFILKGTDATAASIYLFHTDNAASKDYLDNIKVESYATQTAYPVYIGGLREVVITHLTAYVRDATTTAAVVAVPDTVDPTLRPNVTVSNSIIDIEKGNAFYAAASTLTVKNSIMSQSSPSSPSALIFVAIDGTNNSNATVEFTNNTIETASYGVTLSDTGNASSITATFSNNKFKRLASATASAYVFVSINTNGNPTLNGSDNTYCNNSGISSANKFFSVLTGTVTGTLSTSSTVTGTCN